MPAASAAARTSVTKAWSAAIHARMADPQAAVPVAEWLRAHADDLSEHAPRFREAGLESLADVLADECFDAAISPRYMAEPVRFRLCADTCRNDAQACILD